MLGDTRKEILSKAVEPAGEQIRTGNSSTAGSVFRGLLWAEWFAHSKLLLVFLALWLIAVWLFPFVAHPGWILLLGGLYALIAGPAYGGIDTLEGSEEFSFSLPATRSERYLARLAVGGGSLFLLTSMNLLALGMDLPHVLARLYINTGIIKPVPILKPGLLYGLVLALPFTVFAFSFVVSSLTHSRLMILTGWFWGALAALALLQIGFWYEDLLWEKLTGYFSFPLLLVSGVITLWVGHRSYQQKEIGQVATPITLPGRWWLWIIVFTLGAVFAMMLISSLAKQYPRLLHFE